MSGTDKRDTSYSFNAYTLDCVVVSLSFDSITIFAGYTKAASAVFSRHTVGVYNNILCSTLVSVQEFARLRQLRL